MDGPNHALLDEDYIPEGSPLPQQARPEPHPEDTAEEEGRVEALLALKERLSLGLAERSSAIMTSTLHQLLDADVTVRTLKRNNMGKFICNEDRFATVDATVEPLLQLLRDQWKKMAVESLKLAKSAAGYRTLFVHPAPSQPEET